MVRQRYPVYTNPDGRLRTLRQLPGPARPVGPPNPQIWNHNTVAASLENCQLPNDRAREGQATDPIYFKCWGRLYALDFQFPIGTNA
jgi:hypothetical protein